MEFIKGPIYISYNPEWSYFHFPRNWRIEKELTGRDDIRRLFRFWDFDTSPHQSYGKRRLGFACDYYDGMLLAFYFYFFEIYYNEGYMVREYNAPNGSMTIWNKEYSHNKGK